MVRYDTLVWWVADYLPNGYSFYILPEKAAGKYRQIIFSKKGERGKNWLLQISDTISKSELKASIHDTLFGWDRKEHLEFREREYVKDRETGEVKPVLIDEQTQKKFDRLEKKRIGEQIKKKNRKRRKSLRKF